METSHSKRHERVDSPILVCRGLLSVWTLVECEYGFFLRSDKVFLTAFEFGHHNQFLFWCPTLELFSPCLLKSDKGSSFVSEIAQGSFWHFLGLCTPINPFFARSDVSHSKIWDQTTCSISDFRAASGGASTPEPPRATGVGPEFQLFFVGVFHFFLKSNVSHLIFLRSDNYMFFCLFFTFPVVVESFLVCFPVFSEIGRRLDPKPDFVRFQISGRGDVRSQKKRENGQEKTLLPQEKW